VQKKYMTGLTGLTVWGAKRSKRSKRSGQKNMRISELTLVAADEEKRDSIPQNERSNAGIRCRGIEERKIHTPISDRTKIDMRQLR